MKSKLSCSVKSVSRAVSALRSAGVQVRRGKIQGDKYVFFVHSKREKTALSALKSRGIECRVEESGGAEYLKKRLVLNAGALLAAVFAVIVCAVCSLFVFKVEVYCENAPTAALITQFLDENRGKAKSGIDEKALEERIYELDDNVSFVHLKVKGCVLTANVIMQNAYPQEQPVRENVYALCDGVVESVAVFSGTAEVKRGDVIKTGDLLISGKRQVGQDDMGEPIYECCPADGVVTVKTYTGGRTVLPLSYTEKVRTGNSVSYKILNICGVTLGKDGGCDYEFYERKERTDSYAYLPPFDLRVVTYYELNEHIRDISQADIDVVVAEKQAEYLSKLKGADILNTYKKVEKTDTAYIIDIYYEHIASAA